MDCLQILRAAQLAGGMAQKGGFDIFRFNAAAVVGNAQKGHASVLQLYGDVLCPRVDGVFHQLLGGTGGTFHHLSGGNQVGNMGGELLNFRHVKFPLHECFGKLFQIMHAEDCNSGDAVEHAVQTDGTPDAAGVLVCPAERQTDRDILQEAQQ